MNKFFLLAALVFTLVIAGCGKHGNGGRTDGDTLALKYSKLLTIVDYGDDFSEVSISDPWHNGKTLQRYVLIDRDKAVPEDAKRMLAGGAVLVRTPLRRAVVFTSAHCQLLEELGCGNDIAGVADAEYINVADIRKRLAAKKITDVGNGMQPSVEKIVDMNSDGLLISPFENSGGFGKLDKTGIPIIQTADYMETSPLGRAEWIRFYGMLFGCSEKADSLFRSVDIQYTQLKKTAGSLPKGLSILTERKTGSVWYTPGGNSTMGILLRDANAGYAFADDKHSGSLQLAPEAVIDKAGETDVWAFKYIGEKPLTREELLQEYAGYSALKAFRKGNIYECNTLTTPYFETVSFHPELLLREFIQIAHPNCKLGGLRFYSKLR